MINVGAIFITSLFPKVVPEEGIQGEVIEAAKGVIKVSPEAPIYRNERISHKKKSKIKDCQIQLKPNSSSFMNQR